MGNDSVSGVPVAGRLTDYVSLGVLSSIIHRDTVDDVIRECGKRELRVRLLPAHLVVYYVLALNLFLGEAYEEVMRMLVGGLRFLGNWDDRWKVPSTSAISQARGRLGEKPLRLLFERVAVPMARPGTRGAWLHGWRVMAIDGVVLDVPDSPTNAEFFGRSGNDKAASPFPQVRVVALAECGTHAIVGAALGPITTGEQSLASEVFGGFEPGMLVTADRNFYSYSAWHAARVGGAELLWRLSASLQLPILGWLPDGSYRSVLIDPAVKKKMTRADRTDHTVLAAAGTAVRVIEYTIEDRDTSGEIFCLITSILDPTAAPAFELAAAYHQRWEIELTFNEIETHQTGRHRVLRSKSPELIKQEIWGLLLTHYAIRHVMKDAADTADIDPDQLSFIRSYRAIRRQVTGQAGFSP